MADPNSDRWTLAFRVGRWGVLSAISLPYLLLIVVSAGIGWGFPQLVPTRIDGAPWRWFLTDRDGLLRAMGVSALIAITVAAIGTVGGLLIGRAVRRSRSQLPQLLVYLPFVISPVVAGICLYDLLVRCNLAGTVWGVILTQSVFALSIAGVVLSEPWSPRSDRLELLVRNFGGGRWQVFRHAIWPRMSGLLAVCFVQTALFSWLDYGLASVIGGGHVRTLTVQLFHYLREANVNQAAQAGLVLLTPTVLGVAGTWVFGQWYLREPSSTETST